MVEKIYVDASQPASLLDGPNLTDCPTLQEAVIAWRRLPSERQRTARIRAAANVFTAEEIDRLYSGPEPEGEPTVVGTAATVPPAPTVSVSAPPQWTGQVEAASPPRSDNVTIAPAPETVPPAAASNSEQPHVPSTSGAAFPFTDDHSADIPPASYAAARRNLAMQMSGPVEVFPPLQPPPEIPLSSEPTASTAPDEIKLEGRVTGAFGGAGSLATSDADVAPAQGRVIAQDRRISFRDNAERAEMLARALSTTIREEIERLKDQRRNEPEWRDQIDFLKAAAATLDQIAEAISQARAAITPQDREREFIKAETLAGSLAKTLRGFAERNYERIVDYGGYSLFTVLGTALFTGLFGVPAEEALLIQMALLGLHLKKT